MATTKPIEIEIKAKGISEIRKDLKDLKSEIEQVTNTSDGKLSNEFKKIGEESKNASQTVVAGQKNINESLQKTTNGLKNAAGGTQGLSNGFKAVGTSIKAAGIGLVIGALALLKEAFTSNQKTADTFSAVLGTVTSLFSQAFSVIGNVISKVYDASKGFEGLSKTVGGLITLSLTPLKSSFYGVKLVIDEVRLAWEESLFGDEDPKTIKNLTKRIDETKDSLKEVGQNALKAGKQVYDNIGKAASEIGSVVEGSVDGISKISVAGTYAQSKANVQLQNSAKLAAAEQAILVEKYDRQAEKLRQLRDDDTKSITERIQANDELKTVLDNQEKAMIAQANAQVAAAQSTLTQNNNIENQVALKEALANKEGVLAQIEGFRSEQDINRIGLGEKLLALNQSQIDGVAQRTIAEKNFNASLIKDTTDRLAAERKALEEEKRIELERLTNKRDSYKKDTQAYIDANNELLLKQQEYEQKLITNTKTNNEAVTAENEVRINRELASQFTTGEQKLALLDEQLTIIKAKEYASEEERTAALEANSKARLDIDTKEKEAKLKLMDAVSSGLSVAAGELGEATAAGKAAAVAAATISTYTAIAGQLQAFSKIPVPGYAIAQAVVTGTMGLLQVKKILSVKTPSGGGSGGSVGGGLGSVSAPQQPTFNLFGGPNQSNEITPTKTVDSTQANQTITVNAIVSETEMTDTQNRVRRIQENATL
jgi:ElaB/YqjD/DUF883 family membrane-anchored ribosome-binding protein